MILWGVNYPRQTRSGHQASFTGIDESILWGSNKINPKRYFLMPHNLTRHREIVYCRTNHIIPTLDIWISQLTLHRRLTHSVRARRHSSSLRCAKFRKLSQTLNRNAKENFHVKTCSSYAKACFSSVIHEKSLYQVETCLISGLKRWKFDRWVNGILGFFCFQREIPQSQNLHFTTWT